MNQHQTSFARSLSWGVAIGRTIQLPPLGRPATLNHDQMYDDRRAGQLVGVCDRHAPVRVNLFRGQGAFMHTGRGFGLGLFSADGRGGNPGFANINNAADQLLNNRSDRFPSHSLNSLRYGPEPMSDGAQKNGNGSQKDGVS